ncbi:MAG: hypothetical protein P4L87_03420 [Formivibrio sp.]|nr:hypothetical protein [Formivibrio sp.]
MPTPLEEMRIVARRLEPLNVPFAFIGGAVMCLLVDNPAVTQFRRTKDVDVIVAVITYNQFAQLEARLRKAGLEHDTSAGAPIFRWIVEGCRVDIMPEEPANLGMNTRWFPETLRLAVLKDLGDGCFAKVATPPLYLATKLAAFHDRGKSDYYLSHDLEDIVTLIDGRTDIVEEIANSAPEVREFIVTSVKVIKGHIDFRDALHSHLPERQRIPQFLSRFAAIAAL